MPNIENRNVSKNIYDHQSSSMFISQQLFYRIIKAFLLCQYYTEEMVILLLYKAVK